MHTQIRPLFSEPTATDFKLAVDETLNWLDHVIIKTEKGFYWPEQPLKEEAGPTFLGKFSLYSGTTGIIHFYIECAKALGDEKYVQNAVEGARYIIENWEDGLHVEGYGDIANSRFCMINGTSGIAYVFNELAKLTNEEKFAQFANQLIEEIITFAKDQPVTQWTGEPGVTFDAGIALFLLQIGQEHNNQQWIDTAIDATEMILKKGSKNDLAGMSWPNISGAYFGLPTDSILPNFLYGTSGISYLLVQAHEVSGNEAFLQAAIEGATYIEAISTVEEECMLIPHSLPYLKDVHYIGYCHGATGTIRLFYKLYKITKDAHYKKIVDSIVNGLLKTGAPELHSVGYWNTTCQCCGSAALSHLFLGLWADTKDEKYLQLSNRVGKHLLSESTFKEGEGLYWFQAWNRLEPWNLSAKTGYFDGASGNAAQLLHIYLANQNKFDVARFPDDPYPTTN